MLSTLKIDASSFGEAAEKLRLSAEVTPLAMRRAINHTGDKALTGMRRVLVPQTGLKLKVIRKALKVKKASAKGGGSYTITARGGDIRLKFFSARETRKGVTAAPWGKRRLFAGTFIKGGRFPDRKTITAFGGNAMYRFDGARRFPVKVEKSGLFIPEEMVTGRSAETFYAIVERDLPERIVHEVLRAL